MTDRDSAQLPLALPAEPRAKPVMVRVVALMADWFAAAANDNARSGSQPAEHPAAMVCTCNDELGENPAPAPCPRHDADEDGGDDE